MMLIVNTLFPQLMLNFRKRETVMGNCEDGEKALVADRLEDIEQEHVGKNC